MFWNLLLAHFSGDYLLQSDWMVRNRHKLWVLSLHATIHFGAMVVLAGRARIMIWPYLLIIALVHFCQDWFKNQLTSKRPDWLVGLYLIDQALHIFLLGGAVGWLGSRVGVSFSPEKPLWAVILVSFLFVTYVWFVSERIFNLSDGGYSENINRTKFPRMIVRSGLVSLFFILRGLGTVLAASMITNPYPQAKYRQRALLTDLCVSTLVIIFLVLLLG